MIYLFDGAMGTMLQQQDIPPGVCPESINLTHPRAIEQIHRQYVTSGADIIETNTFGANRIKLANYGLHNDVERINHAAVQAARAACGPGTKIAGSVGPTGKLIAPLGDLAFAEACDVFSQQIKALDRAGVDYIIIETIIDLQEMRAALLAAKQQSNRPVICQLSFGADGRTATGTDATTAAVVLEAMGADIIGANCSVGPENMVPIIAEFAKSCRIPISAQPNAGMPRIYNGCTVYDLGPEQMAAWVPKLVEAGATYIGGCCGTTPQHITAMAQAKTKAVEADRQLQWLPNTAVLASRSKVVAIGAGYLPTIIGERINPTGKKILAEDIRSERFIEVKKQALAQVKAGAAVLDVNVGVPSIDQSRIMKLAVEQLAMIVDVPLAIDTTSPEALEAGLQAFPGRALVNSVTGETERIAKFLPIAKKYGAALICLPISDQGIAHTAEERVRVIRQIISAAVDYGFRPDDLLLDALVLTVAAEKDAGREVLRTLRHYRRQFGNPTVMGLSNISYGLPERNVINAAFLSMALTSGLDAPIINPGEPLMAGMLAAANVISGHDERGAVFSKKYAGLRQAEQTVSSGNDTIGEIKQAVIDGEKERITALVQAALDQAIMPQTIINDALTSAMNEIGELFGQGKCFLPQVMLSAETMRAAFDILKIRLPQEATQQKTVVLATVKGDIHDLGKNIVAVLLANNGFNVVDIGKDVPAEDIVAAAAKHQADIIGLCALMTTTMPQIDHSIKLLKQAGNTAQVIVGGAVMTEEYARQAGADGYASDGIAAVLLAKKMTGDGI